QVRPRTIEEGSRSGRDGHPGEEPPAVRPSGEGPRTGRARRGEGQGVPGLPHRALAATAHGGTGRHVHPVPELRPHPLPVDRMSKPSDRAAKELLETDPAAWAAFLGAIRPPELVSIIDSDLSTISAAADKVIRVADEVPWLLHIEFQSGRDPSLPRRLLKYN